MATITGVGHGSLVVKLIKIIYFNCIFVLYFTDPTVNTDSSQPWIISHRQWNNRICWRHGDFVPLGQLIPKYLKYYARIVILLKCLMCQNTSLLSTFGYEVSVDAFFYQSDISHLCTMVSFLHLQCFVNKYYRYFNIVKQISVSIDV